MMFHRSFGKARPVGLLGGSCPLCPEKPPAPEPPSSIEHWLHRSAWAVFKLPDEREALQCAEELSAHFSPGKVEAIGGSVQIDNRTKARS